MFNETFSTQTYSGTIKNIGALSKGVMLWAGGLQLYLRFAWQWHWPLESDLIISCSHLWLRTADTPFHHCSLCVTRPLGLKLHLDCHEWKRSAVTIPELHFITFSFVVWYGGSWAALWIFTNDLQCLHLSVYHSGLISLVAYFLFIANSSRSNNWWALGKWVPRTYLRAFLKSITLRVQHKPVAFHWRCSTLNAKPSSSSSCKPMALCCEFRGRYHMGTFVLVAKRQPLIIQTNT